MTKTIEELKLLAKEKAFDVHLYEGEFSHHETEYTFTETSIVELLQAQDPLQGEPIGYFFKHLGVWSQITSEFTAEENTPLYLAPPSTEALQKDKAELIEYARILRKGHKSVVLLAAKISQAEEISNKALDIPLPKCME